MLYSFTNFIVFQVNDYVKNYIGEGKGPKNFAKEYLERRSKYKNSLKGNNQNFEDELLTPAQAINPNRESENDGWINAGNNGGGGKLFLNLLPDIGFS